MENSNFDSKEHDTLLVRERDDPDAPSQTVLHSYSIVGAIGTFIINLLCAFIPVLFSFFTVQPQEVVLVTFWGKLTRVYKSGGCWFNPIGRSIYRVSTKTQNMDIKKTTVVDANGNPIIVSGVVTFKIIDPIKAAFDVEDATDYIATQGLATLKKVASRYPYESKDDHSLQKESNMVAKEMADLLQEKANICGAEILSYELCDLQYAPEIAQGMLVRQQAQALLEARKYVVAGAVGIVTSAISKLEDNNIKLQEREQATLASNLLAVICSDSRVQPMFSISENDSENVNEVQTEMLKILQQININTTVKSNN